MAGQHRIVAGPQPVVQASHQPLVDLIRDEIDGAPERRITFARFMERALTEPGLGYYSRSDLRPTREGDFLTAPELHPFFGRIIARQLDEMWVRTGRPDRFTVREFGAGRGTLAKTIRAGLEADGSALAGALVHESLDLGTTDPTDPTDPTQGVVGCILANEFVDALPVHRVTIKDGRLLECYVTWWDGRFTDRLAEPSTISLAAQLAEDGVTLAEGQVAEIGLASVAWMTAAAQGLSRGYLLLIDYGHPATELYGSHRAAGTLLGYRGHRVVDDPYGSVGETDLTAHVDLTALDRAARRTGLVACGSVTQAAFVSALGIGEMLQASGADPASEAEAYLLARSAVVRLLDPRHLGAFRVLAWARDAPTDPPLSGFRPGPVPER
ncbi:MAG: SAM-dependent methyltransferase [Chloroflexi bacterium]|nr:SAM-dependent methyltransferase [Chloroflexota bacterium]